MARGWGRAEEDQDAEREQAREARGAPAGGSALSDSVAAGKRRSLELSLARIEDLLAKTSQAGRREALASAQAELRERLEALGRQGGGGGL